MFHVCRSALLLLLTLLLVHPCLDSWTQQPFPVRVPFEAAVWLDSHLDPVTDSFAAYLHHDLPDSQVCLGGTMEPLEAVPDGSFRRQDPWYILPRILLAKADPKSCSLFYKMRKAREHGFAALILYATSRSSASAESSKLADGLRARILARAVPDTISVFFVNVQVGVDLKKFAAEQRDMPYPYQYYVRLEIEEGWISRALSLTSLRGLLRILGAAVDKLRDALDDATYTLRYGWSHFLSPLERGLIVLLGSVAFYFIMCRLYYYSEEPYKRYTWSNESEKAKSSSQEHPSYSYTNSSTAYSQSYQSSVPPKPPPPPPPEPEPDPKPKPKPPAPVYVDPYTTLGISRTATFAQAKQAYHRLSKEFHPDKAKARGLSEVQSKQLDDQMKNVTVAWRTIKVHLEPAAATTK